MENLFNTIKESLVHEASMLLNPSERIYWVFLLGGLVFALGIWAVLRATGKLSAAHGPIAFLFPKRIWASRSAFLDYKLLIVRWLFKAFLVAPWVLGADTLMRGVVALLDRYVGAPAPLEISRLQATIIFTIIFFVANDFSRWFLHMLAHRVPWLWQLHQVHHSAEVMNPVTLYRAHPLETLLFNLRGILVFGLVGGVYFYFFRSNSMLLIGGAAAVGYVFSLLGANLRHTHIWLSYGRIAERFFISPAQHQIHHGKDFENYDKNYGSFLAIWDWMFGSLRIAAGRKRVTSFGLHDNELNHNPYGLWSSLVHPLVAIVRPRRSKNETAVT